MRDNIISSSEVVQIAFSDGGYIAPETIAEADIAVATERWITPVVGEPLLQAVRAGKYATLRDDYLAPAIALYTRLLVQPRLNGATSQLGLSVVSAPTQRAADEALRAEVQRAVKERARAALKRLSAYLEEHQSEHKEYDRRSNILNRVSCDGGFVQIF